MPNGDVLADYTSELTTACKKIGKEYQWDLKVILIYQLILIYSCLIYRDPHYLFFRQNNGNTLHTQSE